MKNFKKFATKTLNTADLSKIRGGADDCPSVWASCNPYCNHFGDYLPGTFTTYYDVFLDCVVNHSTTCSPLQGWEYVCGNDD